MTFADGSKNNVLGRSPDRSSRRLSVVQVDGSGNPPTTRGFFPGNADLLIGICITFVEEANREIGDPREEAERRAFIENSAG